MARTAPVLSIDTSAPWLTFSFLALLVDESP
jgi:hypothetical protein